LSRQTVTSPWIDNDDDRVDARSQKKVRMRRSSSEEMMSRRGWMSEEQRL
jgi:hypothetical protein